MSSTATKGAGKSLQTNKPAPPKGKEVKPPEGGKGAEHHCNFCGHTWTQRVRGKGKLPRHCPKCHSVRWWEKEE